MFKRYLMVAIALLSASAITLSARQLSPEQALLRAGYHRSVTNYVMSAADADASPVLTLRAAGLKTLYGFNRPSGGFVLVAADDDVPTAVWGYSTTGSLPADTALMPPAMRWLLSDYNMHISATLAGDTASEPADGTTTRADVAPLVDTHWAQTAPYNNLCPESGGQRCPTGCVATAMAQVMEYHKWPAKGNGEHRYLWHSEELSVDFSTTPFEWDKMLTTYTEQSDSAAISAVATLMYACGVAVNMNYSPTSSGGNFYRASEALINFFDYDRGMRYISREYYDIEAWTSLIYTELTEARPVLYCGSNREGGHAFVLDGYQQRTGEDYFHINWGWGGWPDGYFLITELNPTVQGTGGTTSGYNDSQNMVIGIQPSREGSIGIPVMEFSSDFGFEADTVDRSDASAKVTVCDSGYIFALSLTPLHASMGVKLTSTDGTVQYVAAPQKHYIRGQAFQNYELDASAFPTEGTWTVVPAVRDSLGTWYDEGLVRMNNVRYATLHASPEQLIFEKGEEAEVRCRNLTLLSPVFSGKKFGVRGTLKATEGEYYSNVYVVLYNKGIAVAQGPSVAVQLEQGQSDTFEWVGTFNATFEPGQYLIELVEEGGGVVSNSVPVTVEATPEGEPVVEIHYSFGDNPVTTATEALPAQASMNPFRATIHISCTSGYFADILSGCIFRGSTGVYEIPGGFVGIKAGQEATVQLQMDEDYISSNTLYNIKTLCEEQQKYIGEPAYFMVGTAAIDDVEADSRGLPVAFYTIGGVRLTVEPLTGIYIAVYADGTAVKCIR